MGPRHYNQSIPMTRVLPALALAAMCAALCVIAQSRGGRAAKAAEPAAAPDKWPIQSLAVEGNQAFPTAAILAVAGLTVGQMAGKAEFDAARDRLTASGAFETVGYKFEPAGAAKGYAATFQVAETTSIFPVQFEDLGAPDADIEKMLTSHDPLFSMAHLPANQITLDRGARWIEEYLATKGKHDKIGANVMATGQDRFVILFRPAVDLPAVAQVTFEGNRIVPGSVLRSAISGPGIGSAYTESGFRQILEAAVRPVYEERGRLHVTFPKIRAETEKDVLGVHVYVTVDEGEVYTLGKVDVVSTATTPNPIAADRLLAEGDFKSGDIDNSELIAAGLERIRKKLLVAGYLDAKVSVDRRLDDAKKIADIDVRVDAGPQYLMGKLTVTGLDLEGEAEIKRIWTLKEASAFNPEYPDRFLKSVRDDRIFDHLGKTKAETKIDAKAHAVAVALIFSPDDDDQSKPTRRKLR
jgi:outer membrane protein insertion porin family